MTPTPTAASDLREAAVLVVNSSNMAMNGRCYTTPIKPMDQLRTALAASPASKPISELKAAAFRLSPDDQHRLATILAGNLGYDLTPEPPHPDQPTGRVSNYTITSKPDEAPDVEVRVVNPITGDTSVLSKRTGWMLRTERKDEAPDVVALIERLLAAYRRLQKSARYDDKAASNLHGEAADALQSERRKREEAEEKFQRMVDYGSYLQQIIEAICAGRDIPEPSGSARHHYEMAVAHRNAAEATIASQAATIAERTAEAERLNAINRDHCRAVNTLNLDGSRLEAERDKAEAERDAIARRHEKALTIGSENRERAEAAETTIAELRAALDAAHYYIDAHDNELAERDTSRDDALTYARELREASDRARARAETEAR